MGYNYKKIEFETQGSWGSTNKEWLYIKSSRSSDSVSFYSQGGDLLFSFDEWGDFDMGEAIKVALTNWEDERMKDLTQKEKNLIK